MVVTTTKPNEARHWVHLALRNGALFLVIREKFPTPTPGFRPLFDCPLTEAELRVVAWLQYGLSNEEIGLRTNLSKMTVKSHLLRVSRTLAVSGRSALVAKLIREGWI